MKLVFAYPAALLLLPLALLPLRQRWPALRVPDLKPFAVEARSWRQRLLRLHQPLLVLLLLGLILALADPRLRRIETRTVHLGVDLMLVLDISASMGADDMPPQRIVTARNAAADFIRQREHDRVGVILFSGLPYLLAPPSPDRERVARALVQVEADQHGSGTALGDALAAALARLQNSRARSRAIILLTDGSSNRGRISPASAGHLAEEAGIRIYTIGVGTPRGGRFHLPGTSQMPANHPGSGYRAQLAEKPLQDLATRTGGRYFKATDADSLERVYRQIDQLEKSPLETRTHHHDLPLGPWLQSLLALLLGLELLVYRIWLRRVP